MTKIALIGEAWGVEEERAKRPFVGYTGHLLNDLLHDAEIERSSCFITNVFNIHPPGNKMEWFCGPKSSAIQGYPALTQSKYVRRDFIGELNRLADEIAGCNPNIVVCLGNTPLWAMCGKVGITKFRGVTDVSTHTAVGFKILPTFHPTYLLRGQWQHRPTVVLDLKKAVRESETDFVKRPHREIWIEPTLEDLETFYETHIKGCKILSIDIETKGQRVTCIGFAPTEGLAICVPFFDRRKKDRSYWGSHSDERKAWEFVKKILRSEIPKVFQNGLYDIAFLYRAMGLKTWNAEHDTMLLHHALQPEALKGLGYLGSIYTDEGPWKQMREKVTTIKRDE
jgi:uracil-DNA glycosylase